MSLPKAKEPGLDFTEPWIAVQVANKQSAKAVST